MKIDNLPFPQMIKEVIKKEIKEFNPVQKSALPHLLKGKNLVVSSPTASGKTLIAEIAIIKNYIEGGKCVYLVPLKALASEKYREIKEKYPFIKTALSIGDLDSSDQWMGSYDLIIASNEKMDSLLRHKPSWLNSISLLIIDEIHMLNDPSRGPTLEIVITRMKDVRQIIALSATIKNAEEIAKWLNAKLIKSNYRPVKLEKGVSYPEEDYIKLDMIEKEYKLKFHENILIHDSIKMKKQCLYFVSTRRSAEASAEKIDLSFMLTEDEKKELLKISKEVENSLPVPTKQCKRLALCIKNGSAFHHAGLVSKQRQIIEDAFRTSKIKVLTATPTLAFGVNLPAYRVIIRDVKRFDSGYGSSYLPIMEVHQMMGRAGRPKYDKEGQAIIMAKNSQEAEEIKNRYIFSEPEPIYSKLGIESMLSMHILALIASEAVRNKFDIKDFFSKTFFAHQYGSIEEVMNKIEFILEKLEEYKFISIGEEELYKGFKNAFDISGNPEIKATKIGKRVSELYINPETAFNIIKNMKSMKDIEILMIINGCIEMYPLLNVKKKELEDLESEAIKFGIKSPDVWSYEYEEFIEKLKTSMMFYDWMEEKTEDYLMEKYGITPGELYNKIISAEWLLYSASELAILLNKKEDANNYNKLRLRIKNGVKEELLRLVKIKGIGRVRARKLYNAGIRNLLDAKNNPDVIEKIVGKKLAKSILSQEDLEDKIRSTKIRKY